LTDSRWAASSRASQAARIASEARAVAVVIFESRAHGQPRAGVAGELVRRRHAAGIRALANGAGLALASAPPRASFAVKAARGAVGVLRSMRETACSARRRARLKEKRDLARHRG
jgi:hypothetical protein